MRNRALGIGLCVAALACEQRTEPSPTVENGGVAPAPEVFLVFTQQRLTLSQLGAPVPAPVTVGSTPSPLTLGSEDPDVVMVTDAGELVGRRNGVARVFNLGRPGDALVVEVRAAGRVKLDPEALVLEPGQTGRLRLLAEDSREIPGDMAEWATDAPSVASVVDGVVEAGARPGSGWVAATYGEGTVRARVLVRARRGAAGF